MSNVIQNNNIARYDKYVDFLEEKSRQFVQLSNNFAYLYNTAKSNTSKNPDIANKYIKTNNIGDIDETIYILDDMLNNERKNINDCLQKNCNHDWEYNFNEDHCNYVEKICKICKVNFNNIIHLRSP